MSGRPSREASIATGLLARVCRKLVLAAMALASIRMSLATCNAVTLPPMKSTPGFVPDPVAQRRLGRYDTPETVAFPLVRWGLRGRPGKVLDPSFGGCSFLRATLQALVEVGVSSPGHLVYGIDVAPEAQDHGLGLIESGVPANHLIIGDFFALDPRRIPSVDLVAGNPPYIRHHWFQAKNRERAVAALARQDVRLSGRANAWAYFLVHAGAFVRRGGRMVLLLPGAVCFADYASEALDYVRKRAGRCTLARIRKRLFADAREDTVVLLVDDWCGGPCDLTFDEFETIEALDAYLSKGNRGSARPVLTDSSSISGSELTGSAAETWKHAVEAQYVSQLGELARIRIGVVTGANRFFVRPKKHAGRLQADGARAVPIVTRGRWLSKLVWSEEDQRRVDQEGLPSRLILVDTDTVLRGSLLKWVTDGRDGGLSQRLYCRRRKIWYVLTDQRVPDAFLRYMGEGPPRIVLNPAKALVTNAVHRVWWREESTVSPESVAVGSCTSLFALGCEIYGRKYGGGVLKIEPGAAVRLPVPIVPTAAKRLVEIDALLRSRNLENARDLADEIVLVRGLGLPQTAVSALRDAAADLAARRRSQERAA